MSKPKTGAVPPSKKPPIPVKPDAVVTYVPPWEQGEQQADTGHAVPNDPGEDHTGEKFNAYNFDHLQERTKVRRRMFVSEYLKDFNGTAAIQRMGLNYSHARGVASKWLTEPYTQWLLDKMVRESEEGHLCVRGQVIAGLVREANAYGLDTSGAARVGAFRALAKILGMEKTVIEGDVTVAGGVMFVPLGGDPQQWEANAQKAQAALQANAK